MAWRDLTRVGWQVIPSDVGRRACWPLFGREDVGEQRERVSDARGGRSDDAVQV
jgi:hypothetical protein